MDQHILRAGDVRRAAEISLEVLTPAKDRNWLKNAAGLDFSCQFTLDHMVGGVTAYAGDLAVRDPEQHHVLRLGNPAQPVEELLDLLKVGSSVLSDVCAATPDDVLGFHPDGPADWSGFAGMGCIEILLHTDDICWAFQIEFNVEEDLSRRLLRRMFPWASTEGNPWQILRWATGRGYLEGADPVGSDWSWHCKPLAQWSDGRSNA